MSIKANYSSIRPSLDLNFAGSKTVDPRVTFTRASTATYYDGKTVAKAEENLLTWSQGFDNAVWVKTGIAVTANNEVAPDGTTTAETITATADNATITQAVTVIATEHQYSIYLKRKTGEGVVEIQSVAGTWTAVTLTTSWQRFNVATSPTAGSRTSGVRIATLGHEIVAWGAQLEQRDQATAYTPTTDQPITRYQPVLKTAAANTPRIDHDPITGECKGLLIEESRTNLLLRSQEFDTLFGGAWNNNAYNNWIVAPVTGNTAIAPDGTLSADTLLLKSAIGNRMQRVTGIAASTSYTLSMFVKSASTNNNYGNGLILRIATGNSGVLVGSGVATLRIDTELSTTEWKRVSLSYTTPSSGVNELSVGITGATGGNTPNADIYIWGAQLEVGAFPTSYIPTTSAQVTRAGDYAAMTGTNFSSWYRQDEGTIVVSWGSANPSSTSTATVCSVVPLNTVTNNYFILAGESNVIFLRNANGVIPYPLTSGDSSQAFKSGGRSAVAYKQYDFAISTNGATTGTSVSGGIPQNLERLLIGAFGTNPGMINGHIKRIAYYPKRLPNAQLQALTL